MTLGQIKLAIEQGEKLIERRHQQQANAIGVVIGKMFGGD